ncbi:MAG: ATP-binding cassette domain-containing protein [Sarcina sp.]
MLKIEVKDLSFNIDKKEILKDTSFEVKKRSFVGIIGTNGSGKSTFLKNIYRFYTSTSGTILLY